jgi:hypothetical protein
MCQSYGSKKTNIRGIANLINATMRVPSIPTSSSSSCVRDCLRCLECWAACRIGDLSPPGEIAQCSRRKYKKSKLEKNREIADLKIIGGWRREKIYKTQDEVQIHLRYAEVMNFMDADNDEINIRRLSVKLFGKNEKWNQQSKGLKNTYIGTERLNMM